MSKITDREIPEEHRCVLCTALSVTELPVSVVERYWRIKRCCDKSNVFPDSNMLMLVAGWDESHEEDTPPKPIVDWSQVPYGAEVMAFWRNKERTGVFQGVSQSGDCFVVISGNPEVREIAPGKVSLMNEQLV